MPSQCRKKRDSFRLIFIYIIIKSLIVIYYNSSSKHKFNIINFILPKLDYLFPSKTLANKIELINPETVTSSGYHEPSLVFLLKGNVLLSKPHEAAIFMAEGKRNISLIEKASLSEFLEAIQELNLKVKIIDTIKGYNIAKGRHVDINIFENQMFDQSN